MNRRFLLAGLAASFAATPALAISKASSEAFVNTLFKDVLKAVNSGKSGNALYRDFERLFARYADVSTIARKALGTPYKSATAAQKKAYVSAFAGYMARNYGKRFNQFKGASLDVTKTKKAPGGFLVSTRVNLKGRGPAQTDWHIISSGGKDRLFTLYIEGVNLLTDVRTQVGSMYDKRGGNMDKLIAHLKTAG